MRNKRNNTKKVILTVLADILVFAMVSFVFAWFHHARPVKPKPIDPAVPTAAPTPEATGTPQPTPSPIPEGSAQPVQPTVSPTPEPTGLLHGKFANKFTDGEIIQDENGYRSKDVCVEIEKVETEVRGWPVVYYVADIYIQDISSFATAMVEDSEHKKRVDVMAKENNAVVAVSGDYWMVKRQGVVVRNGQLYRDKVHPEQDICVLSYDGTMQTYFCGSFDVNNIIAGNPYQVWSFGPKLLDNGQPMTEFNTSVENWNPRCALGYYEPGHYCFVIVDGRQPKKESDPNAYVSYGLIMQDLSQLMYDLGCREAYNLDGGMTAMMAYNGELLSHPAGGGRRNVDILYIAEPKE